jgi:integrase
VVRKRLTDRSIRQLRAPPGKRLVVPDGAMPGLYVRVTPGGVRSFCVVTRGPDGRQRWITLGKIEHLTVDEAREKAREVVKRVKAGIPEPTAPATFAEVSEGWYQQHVLKRGLKSATELRRILDKHVLPAWKDKPFVGIRRSDVAKLLDAVEESSGPRQADMVLSVVRGVMSWFSTRDDAYRSVIVRNMKRYHEPARERTLTDGEIRIVWRAAEAAGPYGAMIRLALLTGQRRAKIETMRWDDVVDGVWYIPHDTREKGVPPALPLPPQALAIIEEQPRICGNPYVLAGRGDGHFTGASAHKARFDAHVPIAPWRFHDLRRTSRSLMQRAGVSFEVGERTLGHETPGIAHVYARYPFEDEMGQALRLIGWLIENIIREHGPNILRFRD